MGKVISSLGKRAIRPFKEFNLEARSHKEILKENRVTSPWHESTTKIIKDSIRSQPDEVKKRLKEKDDILVDRLKKVYVTSKDVQPQNPIEGDPSRPLPVDRNVHLNPEFGYFEPKSVPYGKITLRDFVEVVSKHQQDPEVWTPKKISYEYKLDTALTEKLLRHFRTFVLIVPKDYKTTKITQSTLKTIPSTTPASLKQLSQDDSEEERTKSKGKS